MREEEDNLCCLVLSAKVPCRVALIGHSSPPGILHALVQPEQLYVCVCVCMWYVMYADYTWVCIQGYVYKIKDISEYSLLFSIKFFIVQKCSVQFYGSALQVSTCR